MTDKKIIHYSCEYNLQSIHPYYARFRAYLVQFKIESASVADGIPFVVPPPECGRGGTAVGAGQAVATA